MMAKTHHKRVNKEWFINTYIDSQEFPVKQCVCNYIFESLFLFDLNIVGLSVAKLRGRYNICDFLRSVVLKMISIFNFFQLTIPSFLMHGLILAVIYHNFLYLLYQTLKSFIVHKMCIQYWLDMQLKLIVKIICINVNIPFLG